MDQWIPIWKNNWQAEETFCFLRYKIIQSVMKKRRHTRIVLISFNVFNGHKKDTIYIKLLLILLKEPIMGFMQPHSLQALYSPGRRKY